MATTRDGCRNRSRRIVLLLLKGTVDQVGGCQHMQKRMAKYKDVFLKATGEKQLHEGTLNVVVARQIPIREDFRIAGRDIDEPSQDLVFEKCRINGILAYRIRPWDAAGQGGHGDHVLEIACSETLPNQHGTEVTVEFFREIP